MTFNKWHFSAGMITLVGTMIGQAADYTSANKNFGVGSYQMVLAPLPKKKVDLEETIKAFVNLNATQGSFVLTELNPGNAGYQFQAGQEIAEKNQLGFQFAQLADGDLPDLPVVEVPFGIDMINSVVTDKGLKELSVQKNLTILILYGCRQITDDGIKELGKIQDLVRINLAETAITDEGMKTMANFKNLTGFTIQGCDQVTNKGLKHIAGLKNLRLVNMSNCDWLSDEGVKELAGLKNLVAINLSSNQGSSKISDESMNTLAELKNLESILISGSSVTHSGLAKLSKLPQLKSLDLTSCEKVDDDAMKEVAKMKNLKWLNVANCNDITEDGFKKLAECKNLTTLNVRGTAITDEAVDVLTKALPECQLVR